MIKVVLYDLDNTLYDERQYFLSAYSAISDYIAKSYGVETPKIYDVMVGLLNEKGSLYPYLFNDTLTKLGLSYDLKYIKRLVSIFHSVEPNILLYEDAKFAIEELKKRNYKLGLITNGNIKSQRAKVKRLGVTSYFDKIVYCDQSKSEKPSSEPYKTMLRSLNLGADEVVYVGDNPYVDFYGAKQLGLKTIRLLRGEFCNVVVDEEHEADYFIELHSGIFKVLEELK